MTACQTEATHVRSVRQTRRENLALSPISKSAVRSAHRGADKGADRRFGEAERDDALLGDFVLPSGPRFLRPPHPAAFFLPSQALRCRPMATFQTCRPAPG